MPGEVNVTYSTVNLPDNGPRIAYALHSSSAVAAPQKLALIAHPLGRLGGSKDDHVVVALAEMLARDTGYAVCRYDSRGAGESTGSASWSSRPETEDFAAIVKLILVPLALKRPELNSDTAPIDLLFIGYSAGALAASTASLSHSHLPTELRGRIRLRRVLVSYPLGVLWALTAFQTSFFTKTIQDITSSQNAEDGIVPTEAVLAIWSTNDQFTSKERYRSWSEGLGAMAEARNEGEGEGTAKWTGVEIDEADHFWRSGSNKREMLEAVRRWIGNE